MKTVASKNDKKRIYYDDNSLADALQRKRNIHIEGMGRYEVEKKG